MIIRIVANAHNWGGGEMSVCTIARLLLAGGHQVVLHPTGRARRAFAEVSGLRIGARFTDAMDTKCDVLLFYANNFVYHLRETRSHWERFWRNAQRRVMCLNFDISQAADPWFRQAWHVIVFLNKTKQSAYPARNIPTTVLAPAVDLEPYLKVQPRFDDLHLIRHSKQGKHSDDEVRIFCRLWDLLPSAHFWFMGVPPGILRKHPAKTAAARLHYFAEFAMPPHEFLANGNLFWYRLAPKMRDQGPRVVVEAMAAGLPCVVDDRDGARDRVDSECGWRCGNNDEYVAVIQQASHDLAMLQEKGANARRRAQREFDPHRWCDLILGTDRP